MNGWEGLDSAARRLKEALNDVFLDYDTDCGCTSPCGHGTYQRRTDRVQIGLGWTDASTLGPEGLCGDRGDHPAHLHESASLGRFWCTADQSQREPWRSEQRRAQSDPFSRWGPGSKCRPGCACAGGLGYCDHHP